MSNNRYTLVRLTQMPGNASLEDSSIWVGLGKQRPGKQRAGLERQVRLGPTRRKRRVRGRGSLGGGDIEGVQWGMDQG